jgi:hypothetical protein
MKWPDHPNLRLRPAAPAAGRGRLQRQVRRAFLACGPELTTSQVYDWTFVSRPHMRRSALSRRRVWQLLCEIADPIGRVGPNHAILWRLREPSRRTAIDAVTNENRVPIVEQVGKRTVLRRDSSFVVMCPKRHTP